MFYFLHTNKYYSEYDGYEYSQEEMEIAEDSYIHWKKQRIYRPELDFKEMKKIHKIHKEIVGDNLITMSSARQSLVDNFAPWWIVEWYDEMLNSVKKKYESLSFLTKMKKENNGFQEKIKRAKEIPLCTILNIKENGTMRTKTHCPFHSERTPSFIIYHDSNTFYAFCCNERGDSIDLYSKINKVSKGEAINNLNL